MERLFLDTYEMEYYRKLKKRLPKAEFERKAEEFIEYFRRQAPPVQDASLDPRLAAIYLEENRLDELMEMLRAAGPSLQLLDQYVPHLSRQYLDDCLRLYALALRQAMEQAGNRKEYGEVTPYLKKMAKLCGRAAVKEIVAGWREEYPRRRVMLEVLRGAGW